MKRRSYDKTFYRKLWGLMVPIVLQNLMLALVAVADAFMLGGMDQNYMSAVSLATQIQFIQNMFLAAATASLGILGAQYWGKVIGQLWTRFSVWRCVYAVWYLQYSFWPVCLQEDILC